MTTGSVWREFEHDPRDPQYAGIRASDRDRAVVHDVLAAAYAEGRLDRDEFDDRTTFVSGAKTYAELLPPIRDLITDAVPARFTPVPSGDLERQARLYYGEKLREAFFGFLIPNLIAWAIWFMTGPSPFAWPLFVTIPTGANLARVASSKRSIVDARLEKLQRRQARELEGPKGGKDKTGDPTPEEPGDKPEDKPVDG